MDGRRDRVIQIEDWTPDNKAQALIAKHHKCTHIYECKQNHNIQSVLKECVREGLNCFIPIGMTEQANEVYGLFKWID